MSGIYWLASYPKSGNTWFRSFLCNLQADGDQAADINALDTGGIASSRDWLDDVLGFDSADLSPAEAEALRPEVYRWSLRDEAPAYHKIHDACLELPNGEALICRAATRGALYIVRNPLDVASSAADHWGVSLDGAIERMASEDMGLVNSPKRLNSQVRQRLLSWSGHVLSWVDARWLNCHVIRYEDMLENGFATFTAAARFLGLPCEPERVAKAIRFSDFKELSRQEAERGFRERVSEGQRFFRKGQSGGWRTVLSPEQVERIVADHGEVMRRFGYIDDDGRPR